MRIHPIAYGFLVLAVFFGIILGFQSAGIWSVSGKISADGKKVLPDAADVNSIKGWMTLEQISTAYNVPPADLLKQFNLPADTPSSTAIKDLETDRFSMDSLRTWLQSRIQPAGTSSTSAAPLPTQPAASATPAAVSTEHAASAKTITAKTTFQDVLDWGVSKAAIEKILGGSLPLTSAVIKDYVTGKNLEFSSIKTQLQAEIDKLK